MYELQHHCENSKPQTEELQISFYHARKNCFMIAVAYGFICPLGATVLKSELISVLKLSLSGAALFIRSRRISSHCEKFHLTSLVGNSFPYTLSLYKVPECSFKKKKKNKQVFFFTLCIKFLLGRQIYYRLQLFHHVILGLGVLFLLF